MRKKVFKKNKDGSSSSWPNQHIHFGSGSDSSSHGEHPRRTSPSGSSSCGRGSMSIDHSSQSTSIMGTQPPTVRVLTDINQIVWQNRWEWEVFCMISDHNFLHMHRPQPCQQHRYNHWLSIYFACIGVGKCMAGKWGWVERTHNWIPMNARIIC